ncbi:MAG: hypothetical protein ACYSU1_02235 [Planctomycetota bacterium]|jgi:hypothetical protein
MGSPTTLAAAGWVEVFAEVTDTQYQQGAVADINWGVQNFSADTQTLDLVGYVVYSDGSRQVIQPPQPNQLAPDEGTVNFGLIILSSSAPLGTATFHVVTRVRDNPSGPLQGPRWVHSSDSFDIIP